jgi:hypothetical protein
MIKTNMTIFVSVAKHRPITATFLISRVTITRKKKQGTTPNAFVAARLLCAFVTFISTAKLESSINNHCYGERANGVFVNKTNSEIFFYIGNHNFIL